MKPPSGEMVWWRFKSGLGSGLWAFGYVTYTSNEDLVRMGSHNGDNMGGRVVSHAEIEWKPYRT